MKPLTDEAYLENGTGCCPYCLSGDISGKSIEVDGTECRQEVTCLDCRRTWIDVYKLTGWVCKRGDKDEAYETKNKDT